MLTDHCRSVPFLAKYRSCGESGNCGMTFLFVLYRVELTARYSSGRLVGHGHAWDRQACGGMVIRGVTSVGAGERLTRPVAVGKEGRSHLRVAMTTVALCSPLGCLLDFTYVNYVHRYFGGALTAGAFPLHQG